MKTQILILAVLGTVSGCVLPSSNTDTPEAGSPAVAGGPAPAGHGPVAGSTPQKPWGSGTGGTVIHQAGSGGTHAGTGGHAAGTGGSLAGQGGAGGSIEPVAGTGEAGTGEAGAGTAGTGEAGAGEAGSAGEDSQPVAGQGGSGEAGAAGGEAGVGGSTDAGSGGIGGSAEAGSGGIGSVAGAGGFAGGGAGSGSGNIAGSPALDTTPCVGPPGLYASVDTTCTVLADGVRQYDPQFHLWSDGAVKTRYVFLPVGATIDATNNDRWVYPIGTKFWKEFRSPDGQTRVETRLFQKTGPGISTSAWSYDTYVWSADQKSVSIVTNGVTNALGSGLNVPTKNDCTQCHNHLGSNRDMINGFGAIQNNWPGALVTLQSLISSGQLVNYRSDILTAAVVPGRNSNETAALGLFHVTCGPCHAIEDGPRGQQLGLRVGTSLAQQPIWQTAVCKASQTAGVAQRINPGNPGQSAIYIRDSHRGDNLQMPPVGTSVIDPTGLALEFNWISDLTSCSAN